MNADRKERWDIWIEEYLANALAARSDNKRPRGKLAGKRKLGVSTLLLALLTFTFIFAFPSSPAHKIVTAVLGGSDCSTSTTSISNAPLGMRIALVDQLGSQYPNPGFVENVTLSARKAGYSLDYISPNSASIDFFINLPTYHYNLIILRTHGVAVGSPAIATSDTYSQYNRINDQLLDRLGAIESNGTLLFTLNPGFVSYVMCGKFPNTIILAMTCGLLTSSTYPQAFIGKGAGAVIGWNGAVTVSHTDLVFESLITELLTGNGVDRSLQVATERWGPDPLTGAQLLSYPNSTSMSI